MKKTTLPVLALAAWTLLPLLAACGGTTSETSTPTGAAGAGTGSDLTPNIVTMTAPPAGTDTALPASVATPSEAAMGSPTSGVAATPGQWPPGSPEQAAYDFYNWYTSFQGSPLSSGAYKTSQYISQAFQQRITDLLASAKPGVSADPVICAQNPPSSFSVGQASVSGDRATLTVRTQYAGSTTPQDLQVVMVKENGQWKVDSVACPPTAVTPTP